MLCAAPNCQELQVGQSFHCESCIKQYKPKYLEYKNVHQQVDTILTSGIRLLDTYKLLALTAKLELVYNLRSKYREAAFKPDLHDHGHEQVIRTILGILATVRSELTFRFNCPQPETVITEELEESKAITTIDTVKRTIIKTEAAQVWPKSPEILADIETNLKLYQEQTWLKNQIYTTINKYLTCTDQLYNITRLYYYNFDLIDQYIRKEQIKVVGFIPKKLTKTTAAQLNSLSTEDHNNNLKLVYKSILYDKCETVKHLSEKCPKPVIRIENIPYTTLIHHKVYFNDGLSEILNRYTEAINHKASVATANNNLMSDLTTVPKSLNNQFNALFSKLNAGKLSLDSYIDKYIPK